MTDQARALLQSTSSALLVVDIQNDFVPGGALAEQWAYDLDQTVGRGGEVASYVASAVSLDGSTSIPKRVTSSCVSQ